jgi:hypothetical protein
MNIQIFNDLHVDVSRPPPITIGTDVDVVVVAGDTAEGAGNAFVALRHIVPERIPIVMVMGNHEYYHHCMPSDYFVGRTRVLCNPRGYPGENPNFNPSLVVEVGS